MTDRSPTLDRAIRRDSDAGVALFVVLVVVVVLSVLVTQLALSTKIEERISEQHQGFLGASYSLSAAARRVLSLICEDWTADLEEQQGGSATDPLGGAGSGAGTGADPGGAGDGGSAADGSTTPIDSRFEDWRLPIQESLNDWDMEIRVTDGESRLSVQLIFWYVQIEDDPQNPTDSQKTLWTAAMQSPTEEEDDPGTGGTGGTGDPPAAGEDPPEPEESELILEFNLPSDDRVEKTKVMVSRLIEAVIDYNIQNGFPYDDTPNPEAAAEAICEWVLDRLQDDNTRRIRRIDALKDLEAVGWELFHGPVDPKEIEAEEERRESGFAEELDRFGTQELGGIPGTEETEDGVIEIPRPLGLRDVLTPYSSGRINLNTARPEIVLALLIDMEEYEDALSVAESIDLRLTSYVQTDEDEADTGTGTDEETEQTQEFNTFTVIDDLRAIDEEDDDIDWEESVATYDGDDMKIWDIILKDLKPVATYTSVFFDAKIVARRQDEKIEAELVVARDDKKVKVLSWREIPR
ncbi:MAG: hypothetical protein KDC38_08640 [Planctomycetes bacterium]|nr:hypothetical protein [Planctomycetota bacterium]